MNNKAIIIAAGLAVAVGLWLLSGHLTREPAEPPPRPQPVAERFAVEARLFEAETVLRSITLHGESRPSRQVTLRAETAGPVAQTPVPEGTPVAAGDILLRLDPAERRQRLRQAQAALEERREAYTAARELADEGYGSALEARSAFAALQQAEAELEAAEEALRQTVVRAPFGGIFNTRLVEQGDYLSVGTELGLLLDNDPLLLRVDVPQQAIAQVDPDTSVRARLLGVEIAEARIRYISASADTATRTFAVDVAVPNPDGSLPAGVSAEVQLGLEEVQAHFISPALLSLDAQGVLGVKTVDADERVAFHRVELVRSTPAGVWVSGLPERARIITVGHGFVAPGQPVRVVEPDEDG